MPEFDRTWDHFQKKLQQEHQHNSPTREALWQEFKQSIQKLTEGKMCISAPKNFSDDLRTMNATEFAHLHQF